MFSILPAWSDMALIMSIGIALVLVSEVVGSRYKKAGQWVLILGSIGTAVYLFVRYPFGQASLLLALGANVFFTVWQWFDGKEKYMELKDMVYRRGLEEIATPRRLSRLAVDVMLTLLVTLGMVLALVFLPQEQSALHVINLFLLINIFGQLGERIITFFSTKVYMDVAQGQLLIVSRTKPKQLPLAEMESIHVESAPDVLKLNPLFVIFTSHQDYTSHLGRVLCLTYPGESVYLTPKDPDAWYGRLAGYVPGKNMEPMSERKTLPLWHPSVMKRLLGKLYYSVTVKGISAYSALVLLMYQLELPWWGILAGILAWWGVNLYFSDRVLKAALDGEPLAEGAVYEAAQRIFQRAGLEGVRLYATEANEYNGLAIGMNVGRSMIVLTSATLKLPLSAIEGILAHEAVHVKKRDVLSGQLLRLLGLGVIIGLIVINLDTVQYLVSEYTWLMIALFALMPWLYPIYLSMAHQWMEVRADHLGSTYLEGGKAQMAEALRQLTVHQEQAIDKYLEYSLTDEEREKRNKHRSSELERDRWGWRLLEFQLQFHPPMYWRINTLENVDQPWGWGLMKRWWVDRMMESLPDRWKGKNKACGGAGRDNAPS